MTVATGDAISISPEPGLQHSGAGCRWYVRSSNLNLHVGRDPQAPHLWSDGAGENSLKMVRFFSCASSFGRDLSALI